MRETLLRGIALWLVVTCTPPVVLVHPVRCTPQVAAESVRTKQSPSEEFRNTPSTYRQRRPRRFSSAERFEELVDTVCARAHCQVAAVELELTAVPRESIDCSDGAWASIAPPEVPLRC